MLACGSQPRKESMIAAGAFPLLVTVLRSGKPDVLKMAASPVQMLACGSQQQIKDATIETGALAFASGHISQVCQNMHHMVLHVALRETSIASLRQALCLCLPRCQGQTCQLYRCKQSVV